mmetsp:Transcript_46222/g.142974  ORF Transcript_46222/g.142974 Transcript_46222/m.142974 type:complete len:316 (-) Transcript_46222:2415-3362(-)
MPGAGGGHLAAALALGELLDVGDVVPGVPVERLLQPELVQVVRDESGGAAEHEEAVQGPERHQVVALFAGEGAARADHVHEGHSDAAVHIQDQVGSLARGELLDGQGEVQDRRRLEVLLRVLLNDDDALVGVCQGLDPVADAHDELVGLLHLLDEVLAVQAAVVGVGKHLCGIVQGAAEARADGQQAAAESGDQVLARARRDNRVVRAAHRRAVVRGDHEDHLDELAALLRQLPTEPQEGEHAADADVLAEHLADGHAAIRELLTTVVGDGGDEVCRLADHAQLLRPRVVHGHLWGLALGGLLDVTCLHEVGVDL